jgi:hypothetical protein
MFAKTGWPERPAGLEPAFSSITVVQLRTLCRYERIIIRPGRVRHIATVDDASSYSSGLPHLNVSERLVFGPTMLCALLGWY